MAVLTMFLIKVRASIRFSLVDSSEDFCWPRRRLQSSKRIETSQQFFHLPQIFHIHRRTIELGWIGEIDPGTNAQCLANVPHHGLLNRSVVLHPGEPTGVPDWGKIRRSIGYPQIRIVQLGAENIVTNAAECVCASEPSSSL